MSEKKEEKKSIDEQVQNGELVIDELSILKLQKLLHQTRALNSEYAATIAKARTIEKAKNEKAEEFTRYAKEVHEKYGLKEHHAIDLSDERGGLVVTQESGVITEGEQDK